jgi:hypothetical protein
LIRLTPSMVERHLIQDQENPLAVSFHEGLKNMGKRVSEFIGSEQVEMATLAHLMRRFAGAGPNAKFDVEDLLIDTVGFPETVRLEWHFSDSEALKVTCLDFAWLMEMLTKNESKISEFPRNTKKLENGILRRPVDDNQPPSDHLSDIVLIQKVPMLNQVIKVSASLIDGGCPTYTAEFYDINQRDHKLVFRDCCGLGVGDNLSKAKIEKLAFSADVASLCGSEKPEYITLVKILVTSEKREKRAWDKFSALRLWSYMLANKIVALNPDLYSSYFMTPIYDISTGSIIIDPRDKH